VTLQLRSLREFTQDKQGRRVTKRGHERNYTNNFVSGEPLVESQTRLGWKSVLASSYIETTLIRGDGAVEKFDDVEDFLASFEELGAGAQLQDASGIGSDDGGGAAGCGALHFFP
jgi:hypothetical protein